MKKRHILPKMSLLCLFTSAWATDGNYPVKAYQVSPYADVKLFNEHIKAVAAKQPRGVLAPLKLLEGLPLPEGHTRAYSWCAKPKAGKQVCTYREENIPDALVAGVLQRVTFKLGQSGWYAASIQRAWRCQPRRGNSWAYQTHLCG